MSSWKPLKCKSTTSCAEHRSLGHKSLFTAFDSSLPNAPCASSTQPSFRGGLRFTVRRRFCLGGGLASLRPPPLVCIRLQCRIAAACLKLRQWWRAVCSSASASAASSFVRHPAERCVQSQLAPFLLLLRAQQLHFVRLQQPLDRHGTLELLICSLCSKVRSCRARGLLFFFFCANAAASRSACTPCTLTSASASQGCADFATAFYRVASATNLSASCS